MVVVRSLTLPLEVRAAPSTIAFAESRVKARSEYVGAQTQITYCSYRPSPDIAAALRHHLLHPELLRDATEAKLIVTIVATVLSPDEPAPRAGQKPLQPRDQQWTVARFSVPFLSPRQDSDAAPSSNVRYPSFTRQLDMRFGVEKLSFYSYAEVFARYAPGKRNRGATDGKKAAAGWRNVELVGKPHATIGTAFVAGCTIYDI